MDKQWVRIRLVFAVNSRSRRCLKRTRTRSNDAALGNGGPVRFFYCSPRPPLHDSLSEH